jgi:hypothetical protein
VSTSLVASTSAVVVSLWGDDETKKVSRIGGPATTTTLVGTSWHPVSVAAAAASAMGEGEGNRSQRDTQRDREQEQQAERRLEEAVAEFARRLDTLSRDKKNVDALRLDALQATVRSPLHLLPPTLVACLHTCIALVVLAPSRVLHRCR